jgi:hypothetical protein
MPGNLEQVNNAKKARGSCQLRSNIGEADGLNRVDFDFPFIHAVAPTCLDVRPLPYAHAAGNLSAAYSVSKAPGKYHAKSLLRYQLCRVRFANIGQKARVRCAALGKVYPGLAQAQRAVYGQPYFRGVVIFLAVIFPPADRTQFH